MNVHNIMEELVSQRINNLYDQLKSERLSWLSCDCMNCRLDAISYVLNRIPPKYVVSGRGVTHAIPSISDSQLKADVDALGIEGIRIVSSTKRPFHEKPRDECEVERLAKPVFNMPTFIGTVLDGTTFEPLIGATVTLRQDGELAPMVDSTWGNPCKTFKSTQGTYSFWVRSAPAKQDGESKKFNFTIEVTASDYAPISYMFEVPVVSESITRSELNSTFSLKIKDLILFRTDIQNPMEADISGKKTD